MRFTIFTGWRPGVLALLAVLAFGTIAGCSTERTPEAQPSAAARTTDAATWSLESLPATFRGIYSCDGCPTVTHTLDVWADGVFYHRTRSSGQAEAVVSDDIGRWEIIASVSNHAHAAASAGRDAGKILTLRGGREKPLQFTWFHADTLRLLDPDTGDRQAGSLVLLRQEQFEAFEPRLPMRGMFTYMADAGAFRECLTGRRFPVAPEADNAALESAYLQARAEPGAELLVTLEGRIALRPPMEGDGLREMLIVERFVNVWPGRTCSAPDPE